MAVTGLFLLGAELTVGERDWWQLLTFLGFALGWCGLCIWPLANLTVDPVRKRYLCWWGPFVPMWRAEGRLDDIVGLEVARYWLPLVRAGIRVRRRTGIPLWLDAFVREADAHQATRWLAHDLETELLSSVGPGLSLSGANIPKY